MFTIDEESLLMFCRNKSAMVKSGIVLVLLELLHCQNEMLIELVRAALLTSCAANKLAISSFGAISVIVGILNEDYPDDDIPTSCISIQAKLDAIGGLDFCWWFEF